jgi:hypothetical protein
MKYVVLSILLALVQTLPPVPRQAANNSAGTSCRIQSQISPNKTPPAQSPPPVNANAAPSHDANRSEQGTDNSQHSISVSKLPPVTVVTTKRDWADWGYWVFSGLLVVVGGLQVWLLRRTLGAIQRQADLMERQTVATEVAADAANASAAATKENIEILISKERARIRIEVGRLEIRPPDDPFPIHEVNYKVFCYGTTPAFPLASLATLSVTDSQKPANKPLPIRMSLPSVINPAAEGIEKSAILFDTLQQNGFDRIRKGELFPHFYGSIKYRDVFDRQREYRFRYVWRLSSWLPVPSNEHTKLEDLGSWFKCGAEGDNSET